VSTSYEASLPAMLSRSAAALRSCACAAACSRRCCWRLTVRLGPAMLELQDAAQADARRSCSMSDSPANAALACTDGPADMLPLRRLRGAGAARGLSASAGAPRLSGIASSSAECAFRQAAAVYRFTGVGRGAAVAACISAASSGSPALQWVSERGWAKMRCRVARSKPIASDSARVYAVRRQCRIVSPACLVLSMLCFASFPEQSR